MIFYIFIIVPKSHLKTKTDNELIPLQSIVSVNLLENSQWCQTGIDLDLKIVQVGNY